MTKSLLLAAATRQPLISDPRQYLKVASISRDAQPCRYAAAMAAAKSIASFAGDWVAVPSRPRHLLAAAFWLLEELICLLPPLRGG